ncbi:DNA-directed RNA polymerase subunit omega [Alkalithermobacter thermoalcaliphilus JW-YL-7 = DSM 7308]|uniref:DNA-directed RNA polymerase subunit omega n=1 Tax=Alkalithermobacter thermoalcaliphilus JW-YL-7 = DSM 7308 TaxID=1121328 RepID=A0A150FPP6_CLOPD|nr:DNA-directed RNA polymerase subunit omega [[Clostridium] paradoxum JW-YL-7 = DSM 7308]SHK96671.1 DNA-directed RNA polymerase subunit omega [[Clostridium] paradoxum JW-YL-7 = DSM 7308]
MLYPSINDLLKKVDNRYTLVIAAAKRARQLIDGDPKLVKVKENKPVSIAIHEINEGKLTYRPMTQEEIKNIGKENKDENKEEV